MSYYFHRTCQKCDDSVSIEITKEEAAFETFDRKKFTAEICQNCGACGQYNTGWTLPNIDNELLDIWGQDDNLFFMVQDQELILAELEYLPMILAAIDGRKYPPGKTAVMIEAICVMAYDQLIKLESNEFNELEKEEAKAELNRLIPELKKRSSMIIRHHKSVWDYIREKVFPEIGLETLL